MEQVLLSNGCTIPLDEWEREVMARAAGWIGIIEGATGLLFILVLDKWRLSLGGMVPSLGDLSFCCAPIILIASGILIMRRSEIGRVAYLAAALPLLMEAAGYVYARGAAIQGSILAQMLAWFGPTLLILPTVYGVYALCRRPIHAAPGHSGLSHRLVPLHSVFCAPRSVRGWCALSFVVLALLWAVLLVGGIATLSEF